MAQNFSISQPSSRFSSFRARRGFTLIELLVVIAIILLIVGLATQFSTPTPRPANARDVVSGMAGVARAEALSLGTKSRVAICTDSSEGDKYLRYALTLAFEDNTDPSLAGWKITDRARRLPEGTIFWLDYSTPVTAVNSMKIDVTNQSALQSGTSGADFAFLEFNGLGQATQPGEQWIFTRAITDDVGGTPVVPNENDRDGFIIRQTGRLSVFDDPSAIIKP